MLRSLLAEIIRGFDLLTYGSWVPPEVGGVPSPAQEEATRQETLTVKEIRQTAETQVPARVG